VRQRTLTTFNEGERIHISVPVRKESGEGGGAKDSVEPRRTVQVTSTEEGEVKSTQKVTALVKEKPYMTDADYPHYSSSEDDK